MSESVKVKNIGDMPHCGKMIEQLLNENKFRKSGVAKSLNISPISVGRYINSHSLHAGILWKLGKAMDVNIFEILANAHPVKTINERENEMQQRITDLEKELAIYKEIVMKGR